MDFHFLTKKQAECLRQIHARTKVSSFFEPLRVVRELESLALIRRFPTTEFDSGFGYELTGAGMALGPFEAGTKYSFVGSGFIIIHERPIHSETDRHLQQEVERLEQDKKNLTEAWLKKDKEWCELLKERDRLAAALSESDRTLALAQTANLKLMGQGQELASLQKSHFRLSQLVKEKDAAIAQLQRTVDDYAQRNKVDQEAIRQLRNLTAPTGSVWVGTFADKRLTEGTYVFRNSQGEKPTYVVGTVRPVSDHCMRCRDRLDQPINLNQFTEAMRLDQ